MRKQSDSSISYVFRNFFFLLPFCILPALLMAFATTSYANLTPIDFLIKILKQQEAFVLTDFFNDVYIYFSLINFTPRWWAWALGGILAVLSLCCTFSAVERHMRLGIKRYNNLATYINESFLTVFSYAFLLICCCELLALATSGLILLVISTTTRKWIIIAISLLLIVLFFTIITIIVVATLCTVPSRLMDGYKLNVAMSYSAQIVSKSFGIVFIKLWVLVIASLLVLGGSNVILNLFPSFLSRYIHLIVATAFALFWLIEIPAFSFKTYIDLTNGERKDLKTNLFN
ncbi:MAG: hypothetical protein RR248_04025 [Clostridia bacterium]